MNGNRRRPRCARTRTSGAWRWTCAWAAGRPAWTRRRAPSPSRDGDRLRYDGLVIATGLRPRQLPFGHDLAGVHVLRTLDDALTLRTQFAARPAGSW